jgi:hypothetical protein
MDTPPNSHLPKSSSHLALSNSHHYHCDNYYHHKNLNLEKIKKKQTPQDSQKVTKKTVRNPQKSL